MWDKLLEVLGGGVQSTVDAFQQDWDDVSRGRLPRQAMRAAGEVIGAYGNTSVGHLVPKVPKYTSGFLQLSPQGRKRFVDMDLKYEKLMGKPPPTDVFDVVQPTGKHATALDTWLDAGAFGKIGDFARQARDTYRQEPMGDLLHAVTKRTRGVGTVTPPSAPADPLAVLIETLSKSGKPLGSRGQLLPAVRGNNEIFVGKQGGMHPWDTAMQTLNAKGSPLTNMEKGFQMPGSDAFIPEGLAQMLAFPEGVAKLQSMLQKGLSIKAIMHALEYGNQVGRPAVKY